jgi:hypothetical protein
MQAQTESFGQKGMIAAFTQIFKQEGIRGLWRVSMGDYWHVITSNIITPTRLARVMVKL